LRFFALKKFFYKNIECVAGIIIQDILREGCSIGHTSLMCVQYFQCYRSSKFYNCRPENIPEIDIRWTSYVSKHTHARTRAKFDHAISEWCTVNSANTSDIVLFKSHNSENKWNFIIMFWKVFEVSYKTIQSKLEISILKNFEVIFMTLSTLFKITLTLLYNLLLKTLQFLYITFFSKIFFIFKIFKSSEIFRIPYTYEYV